MLYLSRFIAGTHITWIVAMVLLPVLPVPWWIGPACLALAGAVNVSYKHMKHLKTYECPLTDWEYVCLYKSGRKGLRQSMTRRVLRYFGVKATEAQTGQIILLLSTLAVIQAILRHFLLGA